MVDLEKAEGPKCKSGWNIDYREIVFLKEITWTKSMGLWTDHHTPSEFQSASPILDSMARNG
jgi:hypothetical protein